MTRARGRSDVNLAGPAGALSIPTVGKLHSCDLEYTLDHAPV